MGSFDPKDKNIFDSPKIWTKKKRPRKELSMPPLPKIKNSEVKPVDSLGKCINSLEEKNEVQPPKQDGLNSLSKFSNSASPTNDNMHGIRTAMHVEVLAPNHLRLLDEPRPLDPILDVDNHNGSMQDSGNETMQESDSDQEEELQDMVEESPNIRCQ
ncbi:hypothetical protein SESBI_41376 [Sesbania bispinosa]|nr:hypothetical protein SESBI_41376 [Sesbania bispinosa]